MIYMKKLCLILSLSLTEKHSGYTITGGGGDNRTGDIISYEYKKHSNTKRH